MTRLFPLRRFLLSKPQAQITSLISPLSESHGCTSTRINGLLQNKVERSKSRKNRHDFRTTYTATDLAAKKCVPCNSKDMRPMGEELANELIAKVAGWNLVNEGGKLKLSQSWTVKTFAKGLEFFQAVANVAEAEGGLTENDFILAAKINELDLAHLLRVKPAK